MRFLLKPSRKKIQGLLRKYTDYPLNYLEEAASKMDEAPPGYNLDHHRIPLGKGEVQFEKAKKALRDWRMVELGWLVMHRPDEPLQEGQVVASLTRYAFVWFLNPCRIVFVTEEELEGQENIVRFAFAYGTLKGHVEQGEERFYVDWNKITNEVHYGVLAFSKPAHILTKLFYPLTRKLQKRFALDSLRAMTRAMQED